MCVDSKLRAVSVEASVEQHWGLLSLTHLAAIQQLCKSVPGNRLDLADALQAGSSSPQPSLSRVLHCRELGPAVATVSAERIRTIQASDFQAALLAIKPSVNQSQLALFEQWTEAFGTAS